MVWMSLAARAHSLSFALVVRRTLFATPLAKFPLAKAAEGKNKGTTRKTAAKEKPPVKKGGPAKTSGAHKEKPKKETRVRVPQKLKPPKFAPSPYILFHTSFLKSQPKSSTLEEANVITKHAAEIWRGYTIAEKQPFYDEHEVLKARAKQDREEFFRAMSPSDLKRLNDIRKNQGKHKIHSPVKSKVPNAFILFSKEFRNTPDGQAHVGQVSSETAHLDSFAIAAGERWRSMSAEEKAPYVERFEKARAEFKAEHTGNP